jgi:transposase
MEQFSQLDFTGQTIFAGIDVHKKSWKVCVRTVDTELKTFSQDPSAHLLISHLQKNYPSALYKIVYEAGFCGFHYQRTFSEAGFDCMVVHPADVPTSDKEKQTKSDSVDSRKLSKMLSKNELKGIFIPTLEQQEDRGIIRVYQQMVKNQTRCKNQIWGWLNFQGIAPGKQASSYWSNNFLSWLKALLLNPSARAHLDLLIQNYQQTRQMVLAATKQVRILSTQERYKEKIRSIRSIPGVGQITALLFITEIGEISRFRELDDLCSYLGLIPKVYGSGNKEHILGMTHRAHHQLREKLIEASWTAIRLDPAMTMVFGRYRKRMEKNKAIIKVARKMLNRIRFVMKGECDYVSAVVE